MPAVLFSMCEMLAFLPWSAHTDSHFPKIATHFYDLRSFCFSLIFFFEVRTNPRDHMLHLAECFSFFVCVIFFSIYIIAGTDVSVGSHGTQLDRVK